MPGKKIYIGAKQLAELETEAENLGIDIDELIKRKLQQSPSTDTEAIETLQQAFVVLAKRMQNVELILKRYCTLTEAELLDLGFLRGAIEIQARQNKEAVKAAKTREQQRLQLSKQVQEEINKYLH